MSRPWQDLNAFTLEPLLGLFRCVFRISILLENDLVLVQTPILQCILEGSRQDVAVVLRFHNTINLAAITNTGVRHASPHHQRTGPMLDAKVEVMWPDWTTGSFPVVTAPVRSPDVDFGLITEYHTSLIVHYPILVRYGPLIPRLLVTSGEKGLLNFLLCLKAHGSKRAFHTGM